MKRLLALFGTLLLGALLALLALGVRPEERSGELRHMRAGHRQDAALLQAMQERLATAEDVTRKLDREQDRLRQALRSSRSRARGRERLLEDLLGYLGTRGFSVTDGQCLGSEIGSVRTAILRPAQGADVPGPVVVHIMGVEPLLCDATFFLTVDGIPYQSQGPAHEWKPESPGNPSRMKARRGLPLRKSHFVCMSGGSMYLEFDLPPGPHTLRLNEGCPQGTDVPGTIETEVDFVVH